MWLFWLGFGRRCYLIVWDVTVNSNESKDSHPMGSLLERCGACKVKGRHGIQGSVDLVPRAVACYLNIHCGWNLVPSGCNWGSRVRTVSLPHISEPSKPKIKRGRHTPKQPSASTRLHCPLPLLDGPEHARGLDHTQLWMALTGNRFVYNTELLLLTGLCWPDRDALKVT